MLLRKPHPLSAATETKRPCDSFRNRLETVSTSGSCCCSYECGSVVRLFGQRQTNVEGRATFFTFPLMDLLQFTLCVFGGWQEAATCKKTWADTARACKHMKHMKTKHQIPIGRQKEVLFLNQSDSM